MLVEGRTYRLKTLRELQQTNNVEIDMVPNSSYRLNTLRELQQTNNVEVDMVPRLWFAYYRLDNIKYCCNSEMFENIKRFNVKIVCKNINRYELIPKFYVMKGAYYLQEWMLVPISALMETE